MRRREIGARGKMFNPMHNPIQFQTKGDFVCHRLKPSILFIDLHLQLRRRIGFILLQNRQGKTRLAKYHLPLEDSEKQKHKVEYEVILVTGILHTIVFHRALGLVWPKTLISNFSKLHMCNAEMWKLKRKLMRRSSNS